MTYAKRESKQLLSMSREEHNATHYLHGDFDFHCIAHEVEYSPKYMGGVVCHDGRDEGYCMDECRLCSIRCPVEGCNKEEYYD